MLRFAKSQQVDRNDSGHGVGSLNHFKVGDNHSNWRYCTNDTYFPRILPLDLHSHNPAAVEVQPGFVGNKKKKKDFFKILLYDLYLYL